MLDRRTLRVWVLTTVLLLSASATTLRAQDASPPAPDDAATTSSVVGAVPADTMPAGEDGATTSTVDTGGSTAASAAGAQDEAEGEATRSTTRTVLMYLPNRLLDLVDIVRVRARVGPGTAVGVRATDWADLYLGSYTSVFAGLPGPRMERKIPIPVGLETKSGVEAGPFDATLTGNFGPDYGPTEFGASLHLILIGADLGIDPVEIVDFFTGLVNVDLRKDDF